MKKAITVISVLIIIIAALLAYTAMSGNNILSNDQTVSESGEQEIQSGIEAISSKLLLSTSEKQNFTAVELNSTHEALKSDNSFYSEAKIEDVVYIFQNRVLIYRPSEDIIVNIAPYVGGENFNDTPTNILREDAIISPN